MLPKSHILSGAVFSVIIYLIFPITPFQFTLIFLSSFLIDFDHYLFYAFNEKNLSLKKAYKWFVKKREKWIKLPLKEKKQYKKPLFIFHGIELWIILFALSSININFIYILIGIGFHMVLDFIDLIYYKESLYSKISQIYVYFSNKNKSKDILNNI